MRPLVLDTEVDGFVADRLLEALWREALWLVDDGVATVSQIDDAIRFGAGLRWSAMGTFLVYRMAGGEAGMRHFMEQFGPTLQWPWTKLTDVPELTDELLDRLVAQSDEQAAGRSIRELEALRDDCLVAVMRGLADVGFGAGEVVAEHEERLRRLATHGPIPVVFDDGHRTEVHPFWLRDNCECAECVHPQTRERMLDTFALDPNVAPMSVGGDGDTLERRVERRPSQRLLARVACASGARARRAPEADDPPRRHWGAELAGRLPEVDYGAVMEHRRGAAASSSTRSGSTVSPSSVTRRRTRTRCVRSLAGSATSGRRTSGPTSTSRRCSTRTTSPTRRSSCDRTSTSSTTSTRPASSSSTASSPTRPAVSPRSSTGSGSPTA